MRAFNQMVFDGYVSGTATVSYSDPQHDALLGSAEDLYVTVTAEQVSGTSPTVTVTSQYTNVREGELSVASVADALSASSVGSAS